MALDNSQQTFGQFGGRYVPEPQRMCSRISPTSTTVSKTMTNFKRSRRTTSRFRRTANAALPRITPLRKVRAKIYLKREDLMHGGAHKLNNALGQALMAKHAGKNG